MTRRVAVGDVIEVGEPDYRYGRGWLRLRVTEVGELERQADGLWLHVRGIELGADGREWVGQPRWALVRVRAVLKRAKPSERKP